MLTHFHGSQIRMDLSADGKKFAFTGLVVVYGFAFMFCCRLYAVKQFRGERLRLLDPQHENQLFLCR